MHMEMIHRPNPNKLRQNIYTYYLDATVHKLEYPTSVFVAIMWQVRRNMHSVHALLHFVVVLYNYCPYSSRFQYNKAAPNKHVSLFMGPPTAVYFLPNLGRVIAYAIA